MVEMQIERQEEAEKEQGNGLNIICIYVILVTIQGGQVVIYSKW